MAGTSMAFEADVWSTLENDLFDESGGSARIAGVVLNIAIISHSRQWVIVCFRGKTGHGARNAKCLLLTQSGHQPLHSRKSALLGATFCRPGLGASLNLFGFSMIAGRLSYKLSRVAWSLTWRANSKQNSACARKYRASRIGVSAKLSCSFARAS